LAHTLKIISERSYSDTARREPLAEFFGHILKSFGKNVTVANLNYDTLVLSVLAESFSDILCDMADGRYDGGSVRVGGIQYPTWPLRRSEADFMPFERRRLRLLHLHGSLTYWRFGADDHRKLKVDAVRSAIWETYRNENTFTGSPLVVLANQHEKADYVRRYPYNVAYTVAESGFKEADHWLIVGYSFRDDCVNDLLSQCWETQKNPPKILVANHGDNLKPEMVEDAFGWKRGSAASNHLTIGRSGAFGLATSAEWNNFTSSA